MNPQIINLIITGLVFVFLLFGFFWGLIRGLKKSTFRGAWLIITLIIALFITQPIANFVIELDISSFNIVIDGSRVSTISDAVIIYAKTLLGQELLEGVPALQNLIETLPIMIASPFLYGIIFWSLKIIFWPLWAIISHVLFKQKVKKENAEKAYVTINNKPVYVTSQTETQKPNKYRLLGGLVGIIIGLIVCCATFVPVFGVLNITKEISKIQVTTNIESLAPEELSTSESTIVYASATVVNNEEETTETISLLEYLLKDNYQLVESAQNSVGIIILKLSGMHTLGSAEFNYLSSSKINNTKISLGEDISTLLSIGQDFINLSKIDFNKLTKNSFGVLLNSCQNIARTFKDVRLIQSIGTESLNYFCERALKEPDFVDLSFIEDEKLLLLTKSALEFGITYTSDLLLNDLINLIETVKVFNNYNLIVPLVNNEVDFNNNKEISNYLSRIDENFSNSLSQSIFNINIIKKLAPSLFDIGVEKLAQLVNAEYVAPIKCKDSSIYEKYMNKTLSNLINVISSIDFNSSFYITDNTLKNIGKFIDDLIIFYELDNDETHAKYYIITPETFNNIVLKVESILTEQINKLDDLNTINTLTPFVNNLSNISSYEQELSIFNSAYELLKPYITTIIENKTKAELAQLGTKNFGKALDTLNSSTLINNNIYKLYNLLLNKMSNAINIEGVSINNLINALLINESQTNISFETQLNNVSEIYEQIVLLLDDFNSEALLHPNNLSKLGENLQLIKERNSTLVSQSILIKVDSIVVELLDVANKLINNLDVKSVLLNVKTSIEETVNKSVINYKTEFTHISNIINEFNKETVDIKNFVDLLDIIVNGNETIQSSNILPKALFNVLLNHLPSSEGYNSTITNVLNNASANATKIKNGELIVSDYKNELTAIIKLVNILDSINNIQINGDDVEQIISTLSNDIEYIISKTSLFTNLKSESINFIFNEIIGSLNEIEDSDLINVIKAAQDDVKSNTDLTLKEIYDDIINIKESFSNLTFNESDLATETTINNIDNNLKNIANSKSFSYITSNKILTTILSNINSTIQNINSSDYPSIESEIDEYKSSFNSLINEQISNLPSNNNDITNGKYQEILQNVKTKLLSKPTV